MEIGREQEKERDYWWFLSVPESSCGNKDQQNENKRRLFFRLGRARKSANITCILVETQRQAEEAGRGVGKLLGEKEEALGFPWLEDVGKGKLELS